MSIFAHRMQRTVPIPFDEPHAVTIQKLSGRHLARAKEANQLAALESFKRMGGSTFQKELGTVGDPAKVAELVARAQADPLNGYDRYVVLQKGIVAWTYDEAVSPEHIDDLSEEAAELLARAILELTLPARDEAAQKNVFGSSIAV